MKIIFIGTGNCILDPARGMPCIALKAAGGVHLIDAGPGAVQGCTQLGFSLDDLRSVLLTHFHVDHVLDLVQLLWLRRIHRSRLTAPLLLAGPPGTGRLVESFQTIFPSVSADSAWIDLTEIVPGKEVRRGGMTIRPFRTLHTEESVGYRVESEGKRMACSGDSGPGMELVEGSRNVDIAILECSYGDASPVTTHMGPPECARVGAMSGARRLVLTHLPAGIDPKAVEVSVRNAYRGDVTIAEDFMEIEL